MRTVNVHHARNLEQNMSLIILKNILFYLLKKKKRKKTDSSDLQLRTFAQDESLKKKSFVSKEGKVLINFD